MTPALAATLERVAAVMASARDPWWVIGSAAVVLHGGATEVGDVDLLASVRDVQAIAANLGLHAGAGGEHPMFRSDRFVAWYGPPLKVEFMAEFAARRGNTWWLVAPVSREQVRVGSTAVFVPSRDEMRSMLLRFGREKDLARSALLPAQADS